MLTNNKERTVPPLDDRMGRDNNDHNPNRHNQSGNNPGRNNTSGNDGKGDSSNGNGGNDNNNNDRQPDTRTSKTTNRATAKLKELSAIVSQLMARDEARTIKQQAYQNQLQQMQQEQQEQHAWYRRQLQQQRETATRLAQKAKDHENELINKLTQARIKLAQEYDEKMNQILSILQNMLQARTGLQQQTGQPAPQPCTPILPTPQQPIFPQQQHPIFYDSMDQSMNSESPPGGGTAQS